MQVDRLKNEIYAMNPVEKHAAIKLIPEILARNSNPKRLHEGMSIIFPGFIIQYGSKASLMDFMTPKVSLPTSISRASFFPIPIPCSP